MNESVNGNNENEEKLIINIGEAYRPVVEDYKRAKESMFKPIYEKGRNLVKEICEAYSDKYSTNECKITSESYNNIIAFIGERGSGKTSSMLTFSNLLNDEEFLRSGLSKKGYDKDCIEFNFVQSDVIDPSQFDKNVNILEIILAGMFKNFKNKANKIESSDRQIIIERFEKVYRNLKTLKKESNSIYDGEVLEALIEMSASMEIKENLSKLIAIYLEKVENESNEKSIFVVKIDDIDLNTEHAHAMVEQLRKYLMLPSVIILMALKIDQLHDVVNQTHYISLSELAEMEKNNRNKACISINDKVIDMTEKYLSKLFPIDHRLLMPKLEIFSDSKKFEINMKIEDKTIVEEYPSLDYGIREIIYRKTGLHFIKPDKNENPIVPLNLRELANFVHYIQKFEDVKITSKEKLIRCVNRIIKNGSGNKKLDYEIQKKLQTNGKILEDFSWFLDCPLTENDNDWKVLCSEKKNYKRNTYNKDDLKIFDITEDDIFSNLKNELNLINDYENNNIHVANKQLLKFKNYFLSYWCQNKISNDEQLLITRFLELDNRKRNKFIILELEKKFLISKLLKKHMFNIATENKEFNSNTRTLQNLEKYLENYTQVSTIVNYETNISVGDVLYTLSILEKLNISKEVSNLIFAIKTIYYIELEILNLTMKNDIKKELLEDMDSLIGGEYFSDSQKKIIPDEKGDLSRTIRECKLSKIQDEIMNLEDNYKLPTMIFMKLMFKRSGKLSENYRIYDEQYYDISGKLIRNYDNYVLSITSPFSNSYKANNFIDSNICLDSIVTLNNVEECISNIILLEYIFMEKVRNKKLNFVNPENITSCWHEFYEDLHSRIRFFDGISYFSIFNMNFMRVFRRANIQDIDIIEKDNIIEKLIEDMIQRPKRQSLSNYWNDIYEDNKKNIKKNSNSLEINQLNQLNQLIKSTYFFQINKSNTALRFKEELIDILIEISLEEYDNLSILFKEKDKEWLENNPESKSSYIKSCLNKAINYNKKGDYDEAIAYYNRLIDLEPENSKYWNDLGKVYYIRKNKGDYDNAIKIANKCIELDPKSPVYWNNLGNAYYYRKNEGDYDNSKKAYIKAVELNSKNPTYWNNLGNAFYKEGAGDYNKAITSYNKAIELNSKESIYWANLGNVYYDRKNEGDLQEAINCFETALKQKNIDANLVEKINQMLSKCREELESIESQTEEPQTEESPEDNLEELKPEDNE